MENFKNDPKIEIIQMDTDNGRLIFISFKLPYEIEYGDQNQNGTLEVSMHCSSYRYIFLTQIHDYLSICVDQEDEFCHPHISASDEFCLGGYIVRMHDLEKDYLEHNTFYYMIAKILQRWANDYNPDDRFNPLFTKVPYNIGTCSVCGNDVYSNQDHKYCEGCDALLCYDCGCYCDNCEHIYCDECYSGCEICGSTEVCGFCEICYNCEKKLYELFNMLSCFIFPKMIKNCYYHKNNKAYYTCWNCGRYICSCFRYGLNLDVNASLIDEYQKKCSNEASHGHLMGFLDRNYKILCLECYEK
jgi:hypothetical protein